MWTYQGKEGGRSNLGWKDACARDMTEAGLKDENTTNRAAWRNKIISYTGTYVLSCWMPSFDLLIISSRKVDFA